MSGASGNNKSIARYTGVSIQTAALNKPIPAGWGRFLATPNIIWWNNFRQHSHHVGKGGVIGGKGGTTYTYTTGVILALCEGPIQSVASVYQNHSVTTLAKLGLTAYLGTTSQTPPGFITSKYPAEALSYARTPLRCYRESP
jgi:hypothetical protein